MQDLQLDEMNVVHREGNDSVGEEEEEEEDEVEEVVEKQPATDAAARRKSFQALVNPAKVEEVNILH